jgi:TetR/AcrR family transcriptional regulator, repressor of fatR-cypB operon
LQSNTYSFKFALMKLKDENKVVQIYKATLRLVANYGLSGISMASIAKEAGIGTGTLYTYFLSKEELISSLYLETKKCHGINLCQKFSIEAPVKLVFHEIWMNFLQYRIDNYEEGVFQHQYLVSPYMQNNPETYEATSRLLNPVYEVFERGKREMLIKNVDCKLLMTLISGFVNELVEETRAKMIEPTLQLREEAFSICWDAIKA